MIKEIVSALFGGRNLVKETAEVFMVNREAQAQREAFYSQSALSQYSQEFHHPLIGRKHWFDSLMDGINRLPRPILALGTIGLIVSAMVDPVWFASRMVGLAAVPEPLWWLLGSIVIFYFGGRYQAKNQQFDIERQVAAVPLVLNSQKEIEDQLESLADARMSDEEFEEAMNSTEPLTNEVILEWNKRNGGLK